VLSRKDGACCCAASAQGLAGRHGRGASSDWREGKFSLAEAMKQAPVPAKWTVLEGGVRHTFTHFHLELAIAHAIATTRGSPSSRRQRLVRDRRDGRPRLAHRHAQGDRACGEELAIRPLHRFCRFKTVRCRLLRLFNEIKDLAEGKTAENGENVGKR